MALKSGRVGIHPSQVDPITGMLISSPGGTTDYTQLSNKPQINNVTLSGNKSLSDLGIATSLANLQDVTITDPQDGAYLTYDGASSKWVNTTTPPAPVVPEGSTVTPTDDIQTWLACAGITDKTYTTLNEVLADSTTLLALISSNNASDYLVRSTTWASDLTADSTAMTDIGANNYCANTLLADSTWCSAICNSTYFESVLNVKVPTMTGYTTPSGKASADSEYSGYPAWHAFDNHYNNWCPNNAGTHWIEYEFTDDVEIHALTIVQAGGSISGSAKLQCYLNDAWVDIRDFTLAELTDINVRYGFTNSNRGKRHRLYGSFTSAGNGMGWQMYGRQDI